MRTDEKTRETFLGQTCKCGHTRASHATTWGICLLCLPSPGYPAATSFACVPGECDRFTWAPPPAETEAL